MRADFSRGWDALTPMERDREGLSRVAVGRFVRAVCRQWHEYAADLSASRQPVVLDAALEARLEEVRCGRLVMVYKRVHEWCDCCC